MSKGTVNRAMIIGRMGQDPDVRYMPSGMAVVTLSLATNDGYKDRQTGQFIESTEWHRVTVFGKQAETVGQFVKKGDLLYIEGRIRTNKWQDQTGQDRYTTEIVANQMQMLTGQSDGNKTPLPDYIPAHVQVPFGKSLPEANKTQVAAPKQPKIDDLNDADLDTPPF